ncbi:MAG TPA: diguanylate cyclase, partial [Candidatus Limnocylindrales bacterium]
MSLTRPGDANLSVTNAARFLGVHANTVRAWSDQGRLPFYRINARGDRRYRESDLDAFLQAAVGSPSLPAGDRRQRRVDNGEDAGAGYRDALAMVLPELVDARAVESALRIEGDFERMARWAAQLQSIQQLGVRLSRLTSVADIGAAIAHELRQLIDYHNVRVYRLEDNVLYPIAMLGQVGEYRDETPEQLRLSIGQGLTGWVARHAIPQLVRDASNDPRAATIPGTSSDLDESMLLAPMVMDERVLGVLVLSKLGLDQFTDDDLRLLVIYASFAAQAITSALATELVRAQSAALERQVRSHRELIKITESILGTLEPRAVLDQITEQLRPLVSYDRLSIEVVDEGTRQLTSVTAKGDDGADLTVGWMRGLATDVLETGTPLLVVDGQLIETSAEGGAPAATPPTNVPPGLPPIRRSHTSLIVVPLRTRAGTAGLLTLERIGDDDPFGPQELDLVQLFAAHVSIALQNAAIHSAVEVKARTDGLTGLYNHSTFKEHLETAVCAAETFSLILLDLDDFRNVNNEFGHQAGDAFLREVAETIVGAGRESDVAFRYGGDEFILLLPATGMDGAQAVAERVRMALHRVGRRGTDREGRRVSATASIGVASYPMDGVTAEEILLAADRASFVAKRDGRDRIATAEEGRSLDRPFALQAPTP